MKESNFYYKAAIFSMIATCLAIPFATALVSLFSALTFIFWIFSRRYNIFLNIVKTNPVAFCATSLFILFLLGLTYTSTEMGEALDYLKKYRELLFIPICISLVYDNQHAKTNCEYGFLTGCIILLVISYSIFFGVIPSERYGNSNVFHITHSFFTSLLGFWSAHKLIDSKQYRYFWGFVFLLTVINLFYIAPGRIGMLVFVCLMVLLFFQRLSILQQVSGLIILAVLITGIFVTSKNFSSRTTEAFLEVQKYEYGASRTSLGQRFDWWINSLQLIKDNPVIGHGTGSFKEVHDKFIANSQVKKTDNPHNEFLLIGVQLGIIGVLLFLLLFLFQVLYSFKLEKPEKYFAQGIIVAMFIGCLINSFLFDSHQGHFYAFLSAVYFSGPIKN